MPKFAIAGAGFSGAVIARRLAESCECHVSIFDERSHIGGNCFTSKDDETGVTIHRYGAHIFNTDSREIWDYISQYCELIPFNNRVKAITASGIYSLPVNLHTINQFFSMKMTPSEAKEFVGSRCVHYPNGAKNFEELALETVGAELYEALFKGYTIKQWGRDPKAIPTSILKRLPLRFNYNDNYYATTYQGMPKNGYTSIFENLLAHSNIDVNLGCSFDRDQVDDFDYVFYTGPIDRYFSYEFGVLPYRTLNWTHHSGDGDLQGNAVLNYPELNYPATRSLEHKHFAPWEFHRKSVVSLELSSEMQPGEIPYYPLRFGEAMEILKSYTARIEAENTVKFVGRLGTYRYLNMDQVIAEALECAESFLRKWFDEEVRENCLR